MPLSDAALGNPRKRVCFLAVGSGGHANKSSLLRVLKRLGRTSLTVHGFRPTFRDWVATQTDVRRQVCEQALSRTFG